MNLNDLLQLIAAAKAEEREACAKVCEARAEARFNEHGTTDSDTNACYYAHEEGGDYESRDDEDAHCATEIRARGAK
jgi:hypothetical protein